MCIQMYTCIYVHSYASLGRSPLGCSLVGCQYVIVFFVYKYSMHMCIYATMLLFFCVYVYVCVCINVHI